MLCSCSPSSVPALALHSYDSASAMCRPLRTHGTRSPVIQRSFNMCDLEMTVLALGSCGPLMGGPFNGPSRKAPP